MFYSTRLELINKEEFNQKNPYFHKGLISVFYKSLTELQKYYGIEYVFVKNQTAHIVSNNSFNPVMLTDFISKYFKKDDTYIKQSNCALLDSDELNEDIITCHKILNIKQIKQVFHHLYGKSDRLPPVKEQFEMINKKINYSEFPVFYKRGKVFILQDGKVNKHSLPALNRNNKSIKQIVENKYDFTVSNYI